LCIPFAIGRLGHNAYYEERTPSGIPLLIYRDIECPICLAITLVLPLAVGSLTRYRFQLWMLFAFTAAIAIECAFFAKVWW